MQDDQFDALFNYLQKVDQRLESVEEKMATKDGIDRLVGIIDDFIKR